MAFRPFSRFPAFIAQKRRFFRTFYRTLSFLFRPFSIYFVLKLADGEVKCKKESASSQTPFMRKE